MENVWFADDQKENASLKGKVFKEKKYTLN